MIDSRKNDSGEGEQEYYVKWKGYGDDENEWESESDLQKDGHEQDINDYWTKKNFLEFYDVAIKTKPQALDDLSQKAKKDVEKMLIDLKSMLNKSGSVMISLLSKGRQQGKSADKDKDNFLTTTELRNAIKNDEKLKQLFKIGKTGQVDKNLERLVSWQTWFESMDENNDKEYSIQEFAKSYLAAALKNTVRDKLIDGSSAPETFKRMVALFVIADKKRSKSVVTVMDKFQETKKEIDTEKLPVVTPSPGKFQVGVRVKSTSKGGKTLGLTGIITKRTEKAASVTWDNQTESESKALTQLEPIVMDKTIMDELQEQKEELDKTPVTVVTPSQTQSDKTKRVAVEEIVKKEAQRLRQPDKEKAKKENAARQQKELARQEALVAQQWVEIKQRLAEQKEQARLAALAIQEEQTKQAALVAQQEEEKKQRLAEQKEQARLAALAIQEEQTKQAALVAQQEEETKRIADDKKFIVEFDREKKEYVVSQTNRSKVYQEELQNNIPKTACNPK